MNAAYLDGRPGGVDVPFRPSNSFTLDVTGWPTGSLAGRTFTSTLDGVALGLIVVGDVITVEATEAQTAAVDEPSTWLLTETTGGASNDLLIGTWSPSTRPGTPTSLTVPVVVDGLEVNVTVVSGQGSVVGLSSRLGELVAWWDTDVWDRFSPVVVNNAADSTPVLTVDDGCGVITHGAPELVGALDRRIYYLDGTDGIADVEVRLDWEIAAGNCQCGIAVRGDNDIAIIAWSNIIFGVNRTLLQGVWEFNGTTLHATNQDAGDVGGYPTDVATASGDGTTVTVRTTQPHGLDPGDLAELAGVGAFGQITVVTSTSTSLTFASATSGTWTGGTVNHIFTPGRRKVAVRLVGNTITFKQWLPAIQDEPAWDDPDQAETNTLPATLAHSGGPPPTSGKVGFVVAHLGLDGQLRVNDLVVRNLDPIASVPPVLAVDDTQARTQIGALTARVDDLAAFPSNPTAGRQNLIGWAYDPAAAGGSIAPVGGTIHLVKIPIDRATTVSNILWGVSVGGGTAVAGQNHVGLYSPAGARLATTGVDASIAATGLKTTAVTPVVMPPGFVWVAFVFNVSAGATPALARSINNVSTTFPNAGLAAAAARWATSSTGQTTLPVSITPSSNALFAQTIWAALS